MAGTKAGAAKRKRCDQCGTFAHEGECPRTGRKKEKTDEELREQRAEYARSWNAKNPDKRREAARRNRNRVKLKVLEHYSGGDPKCSCCGESGLVFLTLDHIDGNGAARRKETGTKGGVAYYRHLVREGFPPGYRVLCWNCNAAYGILGYCPHTA